MKVFAQPRDWESHSLDVLYVCIEHTCQGSKRVLMYATTEISKLSKKNQGWGSSFRKSDKDPISETGYSFKPFYIKI